MEGHRSQPDEQPPEERGPRSMTWLLSGTAAAVGLAFVVIAVVVALLVLLA